MSNLELEIRSYIIIFGMAFMISFLSGCGNTISGVGKDISDVGTKMTDWQNKKSEEKTDLCLNLLWEWL